MNNNLSALYQEPFKRFREDFILKSKVTDDWAFPFLLKPSEEYIKSKLKLMIIGQETMAWNSEQYGKKAVEATVESLQERYDLFVNNGGFNSPFWRFQKELKKQLPSSIATVSNNLVKIGREYEQGFIKEVVDWQFDHFNILPAELEVCNPNAMLLVTGTRRYDEILFKTLGSFTATRIDPNIKCLHALRFERFPDLPVLRTYHPNYLQRSGLWDEVMKYIVEFVKKCK